MLGGKSATKGHALYQLASVYYVGQADSQTAKSRSSGVRGAGG